MNDDKLLVLSRNPGEVIVIRHGGERLLIMARPNEHPMAQPGQLQFRFQGPRSFAIVRLEVDGG